MKQRNLLAAGIGLALLGLAATAHAGSYVVVTKGQGLNQNQINRIQAAGGTVSAHLPQIGVAIIEGGDDFGVRAAGINGIRSINPDVQLQFDQPASLDVSEDDFVNPPLATGMDNFFNLQWGHAAIDAAGAWNQDYFGAGATVAVLDSGVNCTHPDLAPNLLLGQAASFVPGETACNTSGSSHGTHVSGTIAAPMTGAGTNSGVIGVAPQAKVIPVKVLSAATGSGSFAGIIQGIVHATDSGANVINMSLGVSDGLPIGGSEVAELVNATARATRYARASGVLVVASAGNDGRDLDRDSGVELCDDDGSCARYNLRAFPAQLPGVLSVASTGPVGWALDPSNTPLDRPSSFTNYGLSAIDVSAPGGDFVYPTNENCNFVVTAPCWAMDMVISTTLTGWGWNAGTSMAAPHVSGVAALVYGKHGGNISPAQVESILRRSADQPGKPGRDPHFGSGRVNASKAVGL